MGGLSFEPALGPPGYLRQLTPERRPYRTKDGYVCAVIYTDRHWQSFAALIGRPQLLVQDERFASLGSRTVHAHDVYRTIREAMPARTTQEWLAALRAADIPAAPLHTLSSVVHDPHLEATGFFQISEHPSEGPIRQMAVPTRWSRSEPPEARHAPRLGEHTVEVLREVGVAEAVIDAVRAAGETT
jgi:crotonobetainyl-CoA:carnitine CoA-transferase CaiB-like acyl-CoA transferase